MSHFFKLGLFSLFMAVLCYLGNLFYPFPFLITIKDSSSSPSLSSVSSSPLLPQFSLALKEPFEEKRASPIKVMAFIPQTPRALEGAKILEEAIEETSSLKIIWASGYGLWPSSLLQLLTFLKQQKQQLPETLFFSFAYPPLFKNLKNPQNALELELIFSKSHPLHWFLKEREREEEEEKKEKESFLLESPEFFKIFLESYVKQLQELTLFAQQEQIELVFWATPFSLIELNLESLPFSLPVAYKKRFVELSSLLALAQTDLDKEHIHSEIQRLQADFPQEYTHITAYLLGISNLLRGKQEEGRSQLKQVHTLLPQLNLERPQTNFLLNNIVKNHAFDFDWTYIGADSATHSTDSIDKEGEEQNLNRFRKFLSFFFPKN